MGKNKFSWAIRLVLSDPGHVQSSVLNFCFILAVNWKVSGYKLSTEFCWTHFTRLVY